MTCELLMTKNRFGVRKEWTCLGLPSKFIHKPIGEWMCVSCATRLIEQRKNN